jgi:hypothetical protein
MKKLLIIIIVHTVFTSCEKEELPIQLHSVGDIISQQIDLNQDYRYQVFYDLSSNTISSTNLKTDWDLGFESSAEGYHIQLNSSTYSSLSFLDNINFNDTLTIDNLSWFWDNPNGSLDSTAFGDFRLLERVYIIDRGYNISGNKRGYKKMIIDAVTANYYLISYANLDNTDSFTFQLDKDPNVNFTSFSFNENEVVNFEPNKLDWDLLFTQYTHLYNDTTTPSYLVTGVLNNNNITVAIDTTYAFEEINYDYISSFVFDDNQNSIGFNWKEYDLTSGVYTVFTNINYIIRDNELRYYKLHFLDFYNDLGVKGYPKFEIQEL